jgi:energy-coupling factor transporter ATP-binding protein EcfA2
MVIRRIEVQNYRSLRNIDILTNDLVALLGRNGAGKSNVLHALQAFYDVSAKFTDYDYFNCDTSLEILIRITYGDLRENELKEFSPYLAKKELAVTKIIRGGISKYYAASRSLPEFAEFRELTANPKKKAFNDLISSGKYPDLKTTARSEREVDEQMELFERDHPSLLAPIQKETQFFGPPKIGGGKLDKFTKFVLIPAVRDASGETERNGAILQLIDVLVARSVNARKDVRELNEEFERRIKAVYNTDNLSELKNLGQIVTELLQRYAPEARFDLTFGDIVPPKIPLPPTVASLEEDSFKSPISYSGHGLQRSLIFALLERLSLTELTVAGKTEETTTENTTQNPDLILAMEEPEIYLHPARSRFLSTVLLDLSRAPKEPTSPRTQILYTTHSPYFVDLDRFDNVRLALKVPVEGTTTRETQVTAYTREKASLRLAEINEKTKETYTAESFVAHSISVMTAIVNEGFFADLVVIVEGISDAAAIWTVQELLSKNWNGLGISIVPVSGKNNIDRPVIIFQGLGIPTYFIFDADSSDTGSRVGTIATNRRLLILAGAEIVEFPPSGARQHWAAFNDELEIEIQQEMTMQGFNELRKEVATKLGYNDSKVLKSPEGMTVFIQAMYSRGLKVKILEEIVENITTMKKGNITNK